MCGPEVAWDWLILDIAYVLVLVGGGSVLRARGAILVTWVWFGLLAAAVGGFLFAATWAFQVQAPHVSATAATLAALTTC